MTRLACQAEVAKLCRVLGEDPGQFGFLNQVPAVELRALRQAVSEQHQRQDAPRVSRLMLVTRMLPAALVAWACEHLLGAPLVATVAASLPAHQGADIASRLSAKCLANVCLFLDPRGAREIIRLLPVDRIVEAALELIQRRDYISLGRFTDFLSDEAIVAVLGVIDDDEHLLRTAFYVEARSRLDHIVRMMPRERLRRAILLGVYPERDLINQIMLLIVNVGYGLQRELGDLAAQQDEEVLDRVIHAAQVDDLWADLLPVIVNMSEESQRKIVNLALFEHEPAVIERIIQVADDEDLWLCVLPLCALMSDKLRDTVAGIAGKLPYASLQRASAAALVGEHWHILMDMAARMPPSRYDEFARILRGYGEVDPELQRRIVRTTQNLGYGWALARRLAEDIEDEATQLA